MSEINKPEMTRQFEIRGSLLARNTLLNLVGQGIPLVVAVVTMPFVIRGLGTERFGLLSIAWVVLGYFAIFDLGLGRATTKFVAEALSKGEEDQVPCLVWTAATVQLILGIVGAIVLFGLTPPLVERILNTPPHLVEEAKATFYLLALSIPVVLVSGSFRGVLEATQRFDLVNAVRIPSGALTFLLPLIGLLLDFSLPGIVVLILLARCGALATFVLMNFRIRPQLRRYSGSFSLCPRLFRFGGWIAMSSIVGPILMYLDRFLIGSLLSLAAVAYYTAPVELVIRLQIIPSSLIMTLFPAFSTLGTMRKEDLQRLYVRSIKYLFLSTGPIVLILMIFANKIMRLWLGADFAEWSTLVFQILLIGTLVGLVAPLSNSLLQGLGRPDILAKLYWAYLPLSIVLMWFLVRQMGIVGAAISATLKSGVDTIVLFAFSQKIANFRGASFYENGLLRCFGVLLGLGALLSVGLYLISTLSLEIGFVALIMVFYIAVTLCYVLDETDRNILRSMLGRLVPIRSGAK